MPRNSRIADDAPILLLDTVEGTYTGAGGNLKPGPFFSGLIDDVRIYNRAVTP